ncbi:MAG: VacJ family lipoprotein [Alphaproteobacteria bacterium]|nr:VacJ family lipoprotein [Alphaproteobacteria bacterium]
MVATKTKTFALLLAVVFILGNLTGCAVAPKDDTEALAEFKETNDPLEPTNRAIFAFNKIIDTIVVKPVARGYRLATPQFARNGVNNLLSNLSSPVVFANDVLQWKLKESGETLGRFVLNSTVGIAGLFDVATEMGIPKHKEDFGQTLAVWGVGEGPYIVFPFVGPTNPRDIAGEAVDFFLDPFNYIVNHTDKETLENAGYVRAGMRVVAKREKMLDPIDDLERNSVDFYVTMRSFYRQYRNGLIKDGATTEEIEDEFDDFDFSENESIVENKLASIEYE